MWFDQIRIYCPGNRKFMLSLFGFLITAGVTMVSQPIAFSLIIITATVVVALYRINPEPHLLLLSHVVLTSLMTYDLAASLAMLSVAVATVVMFKAYGVPVECVVVVVISALVPCVFSKTLTVCISLVTMTLITMFKLRPVQPPSLLLLSLFTTAIFVLLQRHLGVLVILMNIAAVTTLFILNKIKKPIQVEEYRPENNVTLPARMHNHSLNSNCIPLSSITNSLDLQKHTVTKAMKELHAFLRDNENKYNKNSAAHTRYVKVITGKAIDSDPHDNLTLIKPTVLNFLKINKYKYEESKQLPGVISIDLESHM